MSIGRSFPSHILGALAFRRSSCCGAGEVQREGRHHVVFPPNIRRTQPLLFQSSGKRVRQRLNEFAEVGKGSPSTRLSGEGAKLV